MKKVRCLVDQILTTDFGTLTKGNEYNVSDQLAAFLIKRDNVELIKSASKKKASKKK